MSDFAHLHVHTEYSLLDGAAKLKPLIQRTAELGMSSIAMTDHGSVSGAYDFYQTATAAGIKPIIGTEAYIAPGSRFHKKPVFWGDPTRRNAEGESDDVSGRGAYLHQTILAETPEGLRNLFWLSSQAHYQGFYQRPRMDLELLAERSKGLIVTTGCPGGEVPTRLALGQYREALEAAGRLQDIFGKDNVFLELMEHDLPIEKRIRDGLLEIGRKVGLPPLATNDLHYIDAADADRHDTLLCVNGSKKNAEKRFRFTGDSYYLRSAAEMRALFDEQVPGACDNTLVVAERVQSYDPVFAHTDLMPRFAVPEGQTQESWLRQETERGLAMRFGTPLPQEVRERADYELGVIETTGFAAYFLVVADILRFARESGIPAGPGRGSTAGSLVAYALRITEVDPLRWGLLFERFLNPVRVSPPDADLDFSDRDRGRLIEYLVRTYGEEHCSNVITFGRIKAKKAVKDACRVLDFEFSLGDKISKALPPPVQGNEAPLEAIFNENHPRYKEAGAIRDLYAANPDVKTVVDAALHIEGFARETGVHAAGVILSRKPLVDVVPMTMRQKDKVRICGLEYPQAESMGLLKIDFLGLRNLSIMDDAVKEIKRRLGVDIDLLNLPLDDPAVYRLLGKGDTLGVFQLDSSGCRALLRMMEPDNFEDVAAVLALYRPGPMAAHAHANYALRKNGKQAITPIHPELGEALEPILGPTYHLVVYQEQVMAIAQQLAGYTLGEADLLRKAMGKKKKDLLDKEWGKFEAGMAERGFSGEAAKALWDVLVPFSGYAFNKSHAVAYAMIAFGTAYLKAHYPSDYMAAALTSITEKDKVGIYLGECRRMGIKILPPDVNESGMHFVAVSDDQVRFGLKTVQNVGEGAVEAVVQGRAEGPYKTFGDYLKRVGSAGGTKKVVESLVKAGAYDSLGYPRQGLHSVFAPAVEQAARMRKREAVGQDSLFADDEEIREVTVPDVEWDQDTLLKTERAMLGLYVSGHPLDGSEAVLAANRSMTIAEVLALADEEDGPKSPRATICGMATTIVKKTSQKGNAWAQLTVEDLDSQITVNLWGEAYRLASEVLSPFAVYSIEGRVDNNEGALALIAEKLYRVEVSSGERPVEIRLGLPMVTPELVRQLKDILREHPGETPVHLHVRDGSKTTVLSLPDYPVSATPGFYSEVKALIGAPDEQKNLAA